MKKLINNLIKGLTIAVLLITVTVLVYFTGGTKYVFSHSMYLVILLAGYFFGVKGGLITAVAGGLLLGPMMQLNVETGELQTTFNWVYRLGWFTIIGTIWGYIVNTLRSKITKLAWSAEYSPLTGLKMVSALERNFEKLLKSEHSGKKLGVVGCTIQNFDHIVSIFGHKAGENIMIQFAENVLDYCPKGTEVFEQRMGKFVLLIPSMKEDRDNEMVKNLLKSTEKSFPIKNVPIHIEINLGITTTIIQKGVDIFELVRNSHTAQEKAAEFGRQYAIYTEDIEKKQEKTASLLGQLKNAIDNDELHLEYQALLDLHTQKAESVEALIRWEHPELGRINPGSFIPYAEESDLINSLTDWVIDEAIRQIMEWKNKEFYTAIAVNVSIRNMQNEDFADLLARKLSSNGVPAGSIYLEVTEGALMKDHQNVLKTFDKLANIPIYLSIDDFGTGYSSLQYLNKIPARAIKIDRAFINGIDKDPGLFQIVRAATKIGHSLNMEVVAEGVETAEQYQMIKQAQCDKIQGFYIHRPCKADELIQQISAKDFPNI